MSRSQLRRDARRPSANGAHVSWRAALPACSMSHARGAPRSISDDLVEAVLAKTLHEQPPNASRWSSRRLASELGISQRAVLRIWHAFDL